MILAIFPAWPEAWPAKSGARGRADSWRRRRNRFPMGRGLVRMAVRCCTIPNQAVLGADPVLLGPGRQKAPGAAGGP